MKVIRKMFWSLDNDKEIAFLQDWAKKGFRLVSVSLGKYSFESIPSTQLIYQMDFRGFDQVIDKEEYKQLFIDDGWEVIESDTGWYYFCKSDTGNENLSIFNNNESLLRSLKNKLRFLMLTGFQSYIAMIVLLPVFRRSMEPSSPWIDVLTFAIIIITIIHLTFVIRILLKISSIKSSIHE
jgi:hypothetical protein